MCEFFGQLSGPNNFEIIGQASTFVATNAVYRPQKLNTIIDSQMKIQAIKLRWYLREPEKRRICSFLYPLGHCRVANATFREKFSSKLLTTANFQEYFFVFSQHPRDLLDAASASRSSCVAGTIEKKTR